MRMRGGGGQSSQIGLWGKRNLCLKNGRIEGMGRVTFEMVRLKKFSFVCGLVGCIL